MLGNGIGSDYSGQVVFTGRDCSFAKGDRVFGMVSTEQVRIDSHWVGVGQSSSVMQEYIVVGCDSAVALVPPTVSVTSQPS